MFVKLIALTSIRCLTGWSLILGSLTVRIWGDLLRERPLLARAKKGNWPKRGIGPKEELAQKCKYNTSCT